jgi:sugar/nucleoside kinase (ribokinase family)
MPDHDLVVLGDCNPDLLLTGDVVPSFGQVEQIVDEAKLTIGGSGAITAAGAARLGLRTALVSVVGDDSFGRVQLDALRARGVDVGGVRVDPTLPTGVTVVLSRGDDRAILTAPGTIGALRGELVDLDLLRGARHVHATSYFLQPGLRADLPELLGVARATGATVSLDTNWDPAGSWDDGLRGLLGMLDVFLPNAAEARLITGEPDVEAAAAVLAGQVGTVAVKLGAAGGLARSGAAAVRRAALAAELVDTTGAGDSFAAGFLAGRLHGHPLERALALAVACGSLSTRASGGVDAQPTLEEAESAVAAADRA